MPLNAFIVRPFGAKEVQIASAKLATELKAKLDKIGLGDLVKTVEQLGGSGLWSAQVNFDAVQQRLLDPALEKLRIRGEPASAVVVAGNIREDMFNKLLTADVVIADLSIHNPNVYYELGVRQAFRDKYTFLIRCNLSEYPFDPKTDRYFEYSLDELAEHPKAVVDRLVTALRGTISSTEADSPIFKLLPQLEAEDRARFIAVPEEFREEVERAQRYRQREHLSLLAMECEGFLWEAEGLRVVGRAQFESNFIDGAKATWEQIVGRYPDDVEANTVLSTIYQRVGDITRSEQALARVARTRTLAPARLSELRSLNGRNLKEVWVKQWRNAGDGACGTSDMDADTSALVARQRAALASPLLQRAFDAYHEAFKADLNNAYAGLNALTLLVIQVELAQRQPDVWTSLQRRPAEAATALVRRQRRIRSLIAALELAVEADRERLQQLGSIDPWFTLLEAAVECIISDQPQHVAQLYEEAKHFAPDNAEESMRRALEVYLELDIRGREQDQHSEIGTIARNVAQATQVLSRRRGTLQKNQQRPRILMFVGLRLDSSMPGSDSGSTVRRPGFPADCVDAVRDAIRQAIDNELACGGQIVFGLAAGANGGDLLFHEVCQAQHIPTRLCLALPWRQYVGQYVAPAGPEWVERFLSVYRTVRQQAQRPDVPGDPVPISTFTDTNEMPRWLNGRPYYNVGRRNSLWMLQHALTAAYELGDDTEITLLALWNKEASEGGIGGIQHVIRAAQLQGVKVHSIVVPSAPALARTLSLPTSAQAATPAVADRSPVKAA
jgi:hypothetical protein